VCFRAGALVALLALVAIPAVQASLIEDAAGDVQLGVAGTPLGEDRTPVHACVDLRSLDVSEAKESFLFTLSVDDLNDPPQESPDGCAYAVLFSHNGREFQLFTTRDQAPLADGPYASLGYRDSPDSSWRRVWATDRAADWDAAADTLAIPVPRQELADPQGVTPFAGSVLAALHLNSASFLSGGDASNGIAPVPVVLPAWAADRMPDGEENAQYTVQSGAPPEAQPAASGRRSGDRPGAAVAGQDPAGPQAGTTSGAAPAKDAPASAPQLLAVALAVAALLRRR
jgi:hypothetical protein